MQPAHHAALQVAIDLNVFQKMAERGETATSAMDLAASTDVDVVLVGR